MQAEGQHVPVALSTGGMLLLLALSRGWVLLLVTVFVGGLVTPGISGRQLGGVWANGELRQSSRNFRS